MSKSLMSKLLRNPDVTSAVVGLAVMIAALAVLHYKEFHPIYIVAVAIGIGCVLLYLATFRRVGIDKDTENQAKSRDPHFRQYALGAVVLILAGVAIYALRTDPNTKPLGYYILMALAVGSLLLAALQTRTRNRFAAVVILACSIGLIHIWTENLLFPGSLLGLDPWTHMARTAHILDTERTFGVKLEVTTIGGAFSLMRLYLRGIMDTLEISYKTASLVFFGSVQVVGNIILVGLVGKKLFGYKVGAVASVVLAIANWNLFFGEWVIPNAIGATLSLLAAYIILPRETSDQTTTKRPRAIVVMIIIVVAYFTHVIAAVWVVGTVMCLSLPHIVTTIQSVKKRNVLHNRRKLIANVALFVAVVVSLPVWMTGATIGNAVALTSGQFEFNPSLGLTYAIGSAPTMIPANPEENSELATRAVGTEEQLSQDTLGELAFDSVGMFLYIGLALFGILIMLRKRRTIYSKLWAILGVVVLAIGFFPPLFGKSLLEPRWWYFAMVLLAVPLAVTLTSVVPRREWRVLVCVVVCAIALLSTIGLPSNMTNRTFSPNLIVRYAMTESEMQGIAVVASLYPNKAIGADPLYCNAVQASEQYSSQRIPIISIENSLITGDFSNIEADILLIRDAVYKEPFGFGGGTIYKLDPRILEAATYCGYVETWSNGEVHILEKR